MLIVGAGLGPRTRSRFEKRSYGIVGARRPGTQQKGAASAAPSLLTFPVRQATLTLYGVVASTFGR
jgi:hypothetical protein